MIEARQLDLVWVAGGRDYDDKPTMLDEVQEYLDARMALITGGAPGADQMAMRMWSLYQLPYITIPARWQEYGKAAGPMRTSQIAHYWKPAKACLFPGGRGTQHALQVCKELGIPYKTVGWR